MFLARQPCQWRERSLELHVGEPVHGLDAPVNTDSSRDPADICRGPIFSCLDAPVTLFQGRGENDPAGRGAAKIVEHVGFEGRLIGFEAEHIIGALIGEPVSHRYLTAHGADGDDGPAKLAGIGQDCRANRGWW